MTHRQPTPNFERNRGAASNHEWSLTTDGFGYSVVHGLCGAEFSYP